MAAVQYDFVPYSEQVQRLMKSALNEARRARQHTVVLPPEFWPVEPGDFVSWTSARNGYEDKLFRVDGTSDKANLDVVLVLTEVDPSDYDWDHGDYQPPTTGQVGVIRVPAQGVLAWAAEGLALVDSTGTQRRPAIQLSWDGDVPGVSGVQYDIVLKADGSSVTRGRTDQLAAGAVIVSQGILPQTTYSVRGQYIPNAPRDMLWSDWIDVTTPDVRMSLVEFDAAVKAQVTTVQDYLNDKIDQLTQQIAAISANQDARNWIDKKEVRSQLYSVAGSAKASIATLQATMASDEAAFASYQTSVSAQFGSLNASVSTNSSAIATLNGYAAASYGVTLDVNGYVTGYQLVNGGSGVSSFTITADKFQIASPGVSGGEAVPIFTVANVGGVAKVALRGDMYADGTITVNKLNVATLSSITGNIGTLTTGKIQSPDGLFLIDATNKRIVISDNSA
jgi:limonene-1,2-epoxide hydrolase